MCRGEEEEEGMLDDAEEIRNMMVMNAETDNENRDEGRGEGPRRA